MTALKDTALRIASALNNGAKPRDALHRAGVNQGNVTGRDFGGECMSVNDPKNDIIDLGWFVGSHVQVRRLSERGKWMVEVMQRFNDNGTPA